MTWIESKNNNQYEIEITGHNGETEIVVVSGVDNKVEVMRRALREGPKVKSVSSTIIPPRNER